MIVTHQKMFFANDDCHSPQNVFCKWWLSLTTRLPMTTVARKKGTQTFEATHLPTIYENTSIFSKYLQLVQIVLYKRKLDPHAIPHWFDPLPTEDAEDNHEAVHEVGEVPTRHHLLREPLHVVWNTAEVSPDFPLGREFVTPLCDQKFITAHSSEPNLYSFSRTAACPSRRR